MKYTNESSWMCLLVSLFQCSCTRRGTKWSSTETSQDSPPSVLGALSEMDPHRPSLVLRVHPFPGYLSNVSR